MNRSPLFTIQGTIFTEIYYVDIHIHILWFIVHHQCSVMNILPIWSLLYNLLTRKFCDTNLTIILETAARNFCELQEFKSFEGMNLSKLMHLKFLVNSHLRGIYISFDCYLIVLNTYYIFYCIWNWELNIMKGVLLVLVSGEISLITPGYWVHVGPLLYAATLFHPICLSFTWRKKKSTAVFLAICEQPISHHLSGHYLTVMILPPSVTLTCVWLSPLGALDIKFIESWPWACDIWNLSLYSFLACTLYHTQSWTAIFSYDMNNWLGNDSKSICFAMIEFQGYFVSRYTREFT